MELGGEEPQQAAAYAESPSPARDSNMAPMCPVTPEKTTPPEVPAEKTTPPEVPNTDAKDEFEFGWSEEHFCAWRKSIQGPTLRGPIEFSGKPVFNAAVDPDAPAVCVFPDGCRYEVSHITMVPCINLECFHFHFFGD